MPTAPTPAATPPRLSATRFLAFGDSLTAGEVTSAVPGTGESVGSTPWLRLMVVPSVSYPTQLRGELVSRYTWQIPAIQMINAGRTGEMARDGMKRLPAELAATPADVVLLLEGANDLAALGANGPLPAALALQTMVRDARAQGARVFIATLPPGRDGGRNTPSPELVAILNDYIRQIAVLDGAVLVDLHDPLVPEVESCIGADGLHPTEVGYHRMADLFFAAIRAELEVR